MFTERDWHRDFNHADPAYAHQIWDVTRDLRESCPVAEGKAFGGFKVLSRAEDVRFAYRNPDLFISSKGATLPSVAAPFPAIPVETDGREHRAYRQFINKWLSPSAVKQLEPQLRTLVDEHLDRFAARGRCDFVTEFSYPLPAAVIGLILGLPRSQWRVVKELFDDVLVASQGEDFAASGTAWAALIAYLAKQIDERRTAPRDDLLTELATGEVMGRPLTYEESVGMAYTLASAGQDTTSNFIGMFTRHLAENPELRGRLIADPSLIPEAIEEMLRWFSPVQTVARTLSADAKVAGCPIAKGERVVLLVGSANRDRSVFDDPDRYDLDRDGKRQHIAFGYGEHTCAGMHLARMELRIVFERLLARLPDFELDGEAKVYFPGGMVYGLTSLPIRFTPEERRPIRRLSSEPAVFGPYSVRTLVAGADCNNALSLLEYVAGEGAVAEAPHGHGREDLAICMMEGAATFEVEGQAFPLKQGESLFIPRSQRYARISVEQAPARYTMTFTPGGFDTFFPDISALMARRMAEGLTISQILPEIREVQLRYGMVVD